MAYIDNVTNILQIQPDGLPTFVRLSQNENGRNLYFQLAGNEIDIPANSTVTISGTKPDGNVYSGTGSVTDNVVLIPEMLQMTAVAGTWDAKVKITSGGNTIATGRVRFIVDADTVDPDAVPSSSELEGLVAEAQQYAETARTEAYGSPLTASAATDMTDHTRVYVYTGSETGYTAGHWYYWDGSAWTDGGIYNSVAVNTDPTLTLTGVAADAKAAGDAIDAAVSDLKSDLSEYKTVTDGILSVNDMVEIPFVNAGNGYISSTGNIGTSTTYQHTDYVPFGQFTHLVYKRGGLTGSSSQYTAVYNENKEFVRATKWATNQESAGYIDAFGNVTKQDGDAYVRFTMFADTETYGEFAVYGDAYPLKSKFNELESSLEGVVVKTEETGVNLFNPEAGTSGYIADATGRISGNASYITSDFIPIKAGQTVYINRYRNFLAYDSTKTPIADTYSDTTTNNRHFTATVDGYIRASLFVSYADSNMIAYDTGKPIYEPYEAQTVPELDVHMSSTMINDVRAKVGGNVLDGKKWVACGDSFTEGDFSDTQTTDYRFEDLPYYGQKKVYPYFIGRRNPTLKVINEAISGSTMGAGESGVNPFSGTRYTAIPTDADYITLMFGINDAGHGVPLGTIDDADNTTFYGAWNVVMDYFVNNFPYAHIGIIVGPGMQTSTAKQYANAEIDIAKKWGIPYLNIQFESGGEKIPLMLRTSNPDVSNTVKELRNQQQYVSDVSGASNHHPNQYAHEFESTFIEAWLRTL